MLLTIHNLPAATRYADVKSLMQSKCGIQQVILDNLVSEGNSKKVTVGVAEDADAAILTRKINGLFWNGQQLYVEDVRQQKGPSDQPYRSMNPQPELQAELPYNSMNLAQNSSYNMMAAQQMMAPMYYMPIPTYPNIEAYGANVMDTAQSYRQEKVQSAYPGISGFAQNALAAPQYGSSQFNSHQDYGQPAKRSRWEDNQDSAKEKSLHGRRYDENRDWPTGRVASPPRDQSRDGRKANWQTNNDGPSQPDFRANVRPKRSDYRSNAGPTQPDFRPNVRPTEPNFRSTIRPEERSDFVRPALLDKSRREFGSNIQRRENERQERSDERDIFSRRPNAEKFSRRPNNEFSRKPNDEFTRQPNDEFSRRPQDEFSRRPHDEFSRRPNERAEFSRRPNVPDRSDERQGKSQFSGRPSGREEPSRRLNEEFSRKSNDREDRPKRPNEQVMFSRRPNVPNRSNERQGTNQFSGRPNEFSERQGKPNRFNQPNISRNYTGFDRNERPGVSRRAPVHDQRSIPDSRKRTYEEFKGKIQSMQPKRSQQTSAPPKPFKEPLASQPIAAPPLTEQSKERLNKRMRMSGTNKILHDIYSNLKLLDPDPMARRTFRQVVRERVDGLLGDKKMVTSLEILEIYRTQYPKSGDQATHEVVVERVAQTVADQENEGNQEVKPAVPTAEKTAVKPVKLVVQPPPAATPTQMAAPTRPPPPKPPTRGEKRAMKKLEGAKQLMSQGKLPKFPLGDKSKVAQQRKEEKLGIIPETDPIMTAALTDEVDALLQICTDELVNPPDDTTREIYKSVCPEEFIGDIKTLANEDEGLPSATGANIEATTDTSSVWATVSAEPGTSSTAILTGPVQKKIRTWKRKKLAAMAKATSTGGTVLDAGSGSTNRDTTVQTLPTAYSQLQAVIDLSALTATLPPHPIWNVISNKNKKKGKKPFHSPQRPSENLQAKTPMGKTVPESGQWLEPKTESKALVEGACPTENAQTLTAPTSSESDQIPRRSSKPRGKRAGKQVKAQLTLRTRPQSFKRPWLDENTTPADGIKRLTAETGQKRNSAAAFRSHDLCVAVMVEPYQDLTEEQASEVHERLIARFVGELLEPSTSLQASKVHFRGKSHFSEGVLKFWCEDEFTLAWLRQEVDQLESPISGTKLVLKRQGELERRILCGLWVPHISMDTDSMRKILVALNPQLKINTWKLIRVDMHKGEEKSGTHLLFRVPESEVRSAKLRDYRLYWLLGQIYLRVLDKRFPGGEYSGCTEVPTTNCGPNPGSEPNTLSRFKAESDPQPGPSSGFAEPISGPQSSQKPDVCPGSTDATI